MSDELTQEAFDALNTELATLKENNAQLTSKHTELSSQYETVNGRLQGFGDLTPESITEMQAKLEAFKVNGDPDQLNTDLATYKGKATTYEAKIEELSAKINDLSGFKNNTVIGGAINKAMAAKMGDSANQYSEVYKIWVNEFSLNSDGKAVTKEGFTVDQFIDNKLKEPGYQFMKPSSGGGAAGSLPAGGGGLSKEKEFQDIVKALKDPSTPAQEVNKLKLRAAKLAEEIK